MLTKITSQDNNRLKLVRKLGSRKGRNEEGRFVAEGRNLIAEILSRGLDVDFIMAPESVIRGDEGETSVLIRECIDRPDMMVCEVPDREFSRLTDAGPGVGMLAVVRTGSHGPEIIRDLDPDDNILVLDRIQDPGNMGTLIRTAAAAGYKAVIAMSGTVDIYSPKVLRATAGMVFEVPVLYVSDASALAELCSGRRMAVTAVDGGRPYYEENLRQGIALVIGNEGRGVSDEIAAMADVRVTIPMKGNTESLNAAAAAAILMYEAVRE